MREIVRLPPALAPLAELLDYPRPPVVFVVGTGVSFGATDAPRTTWLGLLRHGINYLVESNRITQAWATRLDVDLAAAFNPFSLEHALRHADLVERDLSFFPEDYRAWLRDAFGNLTAAADRAQTLSALTDLERDGALLLTTNYDSLLSDATGLPPVTWRDRHKFHQVVRRRERGILHLHGHWERPDSVILGKGSYDQIVADTVFQDLLKSLWLNNIWVYVGCGGGLDDPNLGALLNWSRNWQESAEPHYFFTGAIEGSSTDRTSAYLVPFCYGSHDRLPEILRALKPRTRAWPFQPVDQDLKWFRAEGVVSPVPSYREYLRGDVPSGPQDSAVLSRLLSSGWVLVEGPPSAGKTTLALRIWATLNHQVAAFYVDLGEGDTTDIATSVLSRLVRPNSLLIVDNIQRQPRAANAIWDRFRDLNQQNSYLVLLATRTDEDSLGRGDESFRRIRNANQGIDSVRASAHDFGGVAKHLVSRTFGGSITIDPPQDVLEGWRQAFGGELHAFGFAVLESAQRLLRGDWRLSTDNASAWVARNWLRQLSEQEKANVVRLALFGAQELELSVPQSALPFPKAMEKLIGLGLVVRTSGPMSVASTFSLAEPGWGTLILLAEHVLGEGEQMLFETAWKNADLALGLYRRFTKAGQHDRASQFVKYLDQGALATLISTISARSLPNILTMLAHSGAIKSALVRSLREQPQSFVANSLCIEHGILAQCMRLLRRQKIPVDEIWREVFVNAEMFAGYAWESSLEKSAAVLKLAKAHCGSADILWQAIEAQPDKMIVAVRNTSLEHVCSFLRVAKVQKRKVDYVHTAITADVPQLASRLHRTSLGHIAALIEAMHDSGWSTVAIWEELERDADALARRASETPLDLLVHFVDVSAKHGRDLRPLLKGIAAGSDDLIARVQRTPLEHLAAFVECGRRHAFDVDFVWRALELEPGLIAARARSAEYPQLVGFLRVAPEEIVKLVAAGLAPLRSNSVDDLPAAVWVVKRLSESSERALADELARLIIEQCRPDRFHPTNSTLRQIAWITGHALKSGIDVGSFLETMCTPSWLGTIYTSTPFAGALADGLSELSMVDNALVRSRFDDPSRERRLHREIARFESAKDVASKIQVVSLLGAIELLGCEASARDIAKMLSALQHNLPDMLENEEFRGEKFFYRMRQFWLGIRAIVSRSGRALSVPPESLTHARDLWDIERMPQNNRTVVARNITQSMAAWLSDCLAQEIPCAIPSPQQLSTLLVRSAEQ